MGKKTNLQLEELLYLSKGEPMVSPDFSSSDVFQDLEKDLMASFSLDALRRVTAYANKFEIRHQEQLYDLFHLVRNALIKGYRMAEQNWTEQ